MSATTTVPPYSIRIAYQGEPGAYSEKASREMLGPRVTTINYESFEDAFKAVALKEADYTVVPIENSLGGSIHTNFDLLLRYDLHVIGEHEFRVEHSLLSAPSLPFETRQPLQGLSVETPCAYTTYMVSICNGSVYRLR